MTAVAEAEARLGFTDDAIRTALSVGMTAGPHPFIKAERAAALARVGVARAASGDKEAGRKLIQDALAMVPIAPIAPFGEPFQAYFGKIAECQAEMGDFSEAVRTIDAIGAHEFDQLTACFKARALIALARAQAAAGQDAAARTSCQRAAEFTAQAQIDSMDDFYPDISKISGESGDLDAAIHLASTIHEKSVRAMVLIQLIEARGKAKDLAGVRKAAQAAAGKAFQGWDYDPTIIGALAAAGETDEALRRAKGLGDPDQRAAALLEICETFGPGD